MDYKQYMQSSNKPYALPSVRWLPIVRRGKLLCRFDYLRGVLEIQSRGEMETVDLASEVEKYEQQQAQGSNVKIVS